MTVKHRGWAMVMGRVACGARPGPEGFALETEDVTCQRCLRKMVREAFADVGECRVKLEIAEREHNDLREQLKKVRS